MAVNLFDGFGATPLGVALAVEPRSQASTPRVGLPLRIQNRRPALEG
jgi:hypothetical protein